MRDITVRAEDLSNRGVRRLIAIFVKKGEVAEWSAENNGWVSLPLDAHLDAQLAESAAKPLTERIEELELARAVDRLGDLPYVLTGGTAALLQGAPVPVEAVEIAVAWRDADAFTEWLTRSYGQRWHEQYQEFGYLPLDPREPGACPR